MSAADNMTDDEIRARIAQLEGDIALGERDPDAYMRKFHSEMVAEREQAERALAETKCQIALLEAEREEIRARIEASKTLRVLIRPAPGAQWHPPTRGRA